MVQALREPMLCCIHARASCRLHVIVSSMFAFEYLHYSLTTFLGKYENDRRLVCPMHIYVNQIQAHVNDR